MWQGNALMSSSQNVDIVRLYHNGVCYVEHDKTWTLNVDIVRLYHNGVCYVEHDAGTVRTVHYGH